MSGGNEQAGPLGTGKYDNWYFDLDRGWVERLPKSDLTGDTARPDNNPKSAYGIKKPPLHLIPPAAKVEHAAAMGVGAQKYGPYNWRETAVAASVYVAAAERHIDAWWDGEDLDPETLVNHLGHAMACCGILIDAIATGNLIDDRPQVQGLAGELHRAYKARCEAVMKSDAIRFDVDHSLQKHRENKQPEAAPDDMWSRLFVVGDRVKHHLRGKEGDVHALRTSHMTSIGVRWDRVKYKRQTCDWYRPSDLEILPKMSGSAETDVKQF